MLFPDSDPPFAGYETRRMALSEQWRSMQSKFYDTAIASFYPATFNCNFCELPEDDGKIIRCTDCSNQYFCTNCFVSKHYNLLHLPDVWNTEVSVVR